MERIRMSKRYRAIVSIPVEAENDDEAFEIAATRAHSLRHEGVAIGHLESLGEVDPDGLLEIDRVAYETPDFRKHRLVSPHRGGREPRRP
jgi:hypothetical protein